MTHCGWPSRIMAASVRRNGRSERGTLTGTACANWRMAERCCQLPDAWNPPVTTAAGSLNRERDHESAQEQRGLRSLTHRAGDGTRDGWRHVALVYPGIRTRIRGR